MTAELNVKNITQVGENDHGYRFAVASIGKGDKLRWIGYADSNVGAFIFPSISEGYEMGVKDKELAIKMTGAIAQAPENGYGGVERWFVPEELRGNPADYRCKNCESIGCDGECESGDPWEGIFDEDPV